MNIVVNKLDSVTLMELPGRALDAGSAPAFKAATLNLLEPGARIVIDMGHLDFVDSTALGTLVSCLRHAHGAKGEIKLCRLTKPVRSLFELVRMHRVFEIFDTVDDARKSYTA